MKLFPSLFAENIKSYTYNTSFDKVRLTIESVFDRSNQILSFYDINGRFTGGNTFLIESPVSAYTYGVGYQSKLYGVLVANSSGGTIIETRTRSAVSLRILFWVIIIMGIIYISQYFITATPETIWTGIVILAIGPFLIAKIADINNGVIEDRYNRHLHKEILNVKLTGCA